MATGVRQQKLLEKLEMMTEYEKAHWERGELFVAGVDEAGRGPLAGPVVAACAIMPKDRLIVGIDDSKRLSEKRREELYAEIIDTCIDYGVCMIENEEIDEINILNAAKKAFVGALAELRKTPDHIYTDAMTLEIEAPHTAVIKGDSKIYTIAAASIIAKVTRDRLMAKYEEEYPGYGFISHKGYGTKAHYEALDRYGVTPIHRQSFLKKYFAARGR